MMRLWMSTTMPGYLTDFFLMCMGILAVYLVYARYSGKPKEDIRSPGTGVIGSER